MSEYTGVRFKAIVKPEMSEVVETMMTEWHNAEEMAEEYPQHTFFKEFSKAPSSSRIPFGIVECMPNEWDTREGHFSTSYDIESREWSFMCSLKNHDKTIEKFFDLVVASLIEKSVHIEVLSEYWKESVFYEFSDGAVVKSAQKGIQYTS